MPRLSLTQGTPVDEWATRSLGLVIYDFSSSADPYHMTASSLTDIRRRSVRSVSVRSVSARLSAGGLRLERPLVGVGRQEEGARGNVEGCAVAAAAGAARRGAAAAVSGVTERRQSSNNAVLLGCAPLRSQR